VPAQSLGAQVLIGLLERTGISGELVDEVIVGHCNPTAEAPAIGRVIALDAGLPETTSGLQVDRRCGSGLQAVIDAVAHVESGACDLVIAGGAESMSRAPYYSVEGRWGLPPGALVLHDALERGRTTAGGANFPVPGGMIETAENLRVQYAISREEQDQLAARSHQRAVAAQESGLFDEEIVPIRFTSRGKEQVVEVDEHPRPGSSVEALAKLRPVYAAKDPQATVTAGNASGQNDGAAMCVVTTLEKATALGLAPRARLVGWSAAGVPPRTMGIGPVPAVAKLLKRVGVPLEEIDLLEINEAFAVQVLACTREWGFGGFDSEEWNRTNVNGSGISLGHPVGATGVRILTTLLRELDRRQARYGLETMCIGGGQGLAALFEREA
jgi:acetyl-CoA C-acetyltransferase